VPNLIADVEEQRWRISVVVAQHMVPNSLFTWFIIRLFQLVFSAETVFFSHNKSANSVFSRLISLAEWGQNPNFIIEP
jgi:hypothetical protein